MTASVIQSIAQPTALAEPFDSVALDYDRLFTIRLLAKRSGLRYREQIERCFAPGSHVLELNCGTGEDALALARSGVRVSAYDASPEMIETANQADERTVIFKCAILRPAQRASLQVGRLIFDGAFRTSGDSTVRLTGRYCRRACPPRETRRAFAALCTGPQVLVGDGLLSSAWALPQSLPARSPRPSIARIDGTSFNIIYPSVTEIKAIVLLRVSAMWMARRGCLRASILLRTAYSGAEEGVWSAFVS
jgi:SAM-dependent methyltransferase